MSENRFFGALTGILTLALLVLAGRVDWPSLPPVGVVAFLVVALVGVAGGLVAVRWAADRSLSQPLAHPIY